jgi:short subunit fatty acids transporter
MMPNHGTDAVQRIQQLPDIVARLAPNAITASVILTLTAIALSLALRNPVTRILDAYHRGLWMLLQPDDPPTPRRRRSRCR